MRRQRGMSYVVVMIVVAIASVAAVRAVETTATAERRARETELMWAGQAYYDAIRSYYELSPGTVKTYPASLDLLLLDDRTSTMRRHLRKLYRDPITGSETWGLLVDADGKVQGVYSLSSKAPLKKGGFASEFTGFAGATSYQQWQFKYVAN